MRDGLTVKKKMENQLIGQSDYDVKMKNHRKHTAKLEENIWYYLQHSSKSKAQMRDVLVKVLRRCS